MRLRPDRKGLIVNSDEIVPRISQTRINNIVDQGGKEADGVKNTIIDGEKIKLLSGSNIAADFIKLVDKYVLSKWGK